MSHLSRLEEGAVSADEAASASPLISSPSVPPSSSSFSSPSSPLVAWARAKFVTPLISLMKSGATAEGLALSFAFGLTGGIFPVPATTTVACVALSWLFRLNFAAVQIINLLMTPVNFATFLWFIYAGETLFGAEHVELSLGSLQNDPILATIQKFWISLFYGIIAWLIFLAVTTPLLYAAFKPLVRKAMKRLKFP